MLDVPFEFSKAKAMNDPVAIHWWFGGGAVNQEGPCGQDKAEHKGGGLGGPEQVQTDQEIIGERGVEIEHGGAESKVQI